MLADEMGLGKTAQSVAMLDHLYRHPQSSGGGSGGGDGGGGGGGGGGSGGGGGGGDGGSSCCSGGVEALKRRSRPLTLMRVLTCGNWDTAIA